MSYILNIKILAGAGCLVALLTACSPSSDADRASQPAQASAPAASAAANRIAAEVLNAASQADILHTSASEAASPDPLPAPGNAFPHAHTVPMPLDTPLSASEIAKLPPLPAECERYYRRVDACFAQQGEDAEELRRQNQDARLEALRQQPDQAACIALNQSFDQLAPHLSCQ